ncbi:MAG: flagellar biosynthesis protein FlgF [SAR86 cluster bacterium]|uniref:Flagellar basal-body rod protein FlgF n=1 Tax=SAR86 cluster bacterium TaxID=2030880 RepID=A0A2A4XHL4_9GAMM|nr:MAG: flagellar biosynthesis protein FlgF [SAR86 cluster bacterium]
MHELLLSITHSAKQTMQAQAINAHNLANAGTEGFKAEIAYYSTQNATSTVSSSPDLSPGVVRTTGRNLDVSINGEGWIAVMAEDGTEAYSRRGDLQLDAFGQLTNGVGQAIMGNNGPIALPPFGTLEIGSDGTISILPLGQTPNTLAVVDRIKLVKLEGSEVRRGVDGLVRMPDGFAVDADSSVSVLSGMLEGSNVNVVGEMVKMIDLARRFESEIKLMQSAKENSAALTKIMSLN